ncbi:MAG: NAD(P)-dependent glycerol-3-phosphate dehydrogenase [Actinomycetota bacterium]|jgi:glycerol-3-phosphate dehydrogenase (NAD(P)+)|nr:NAD(P)-dependent glycerol-3-phosphate dehydrogenase [Actinomycetota bacterium]MDQ3451031.1 NAD(P)-dependent glycerol-3-phosphate dehydrogenase [Actinomycetota bacterium]
MVLADAGSDVTLLARRPDLADRIARTRENADYLPGVELSDAIACTSDAATALRGAEIVVMAVPSQTLRANLVAWTPFLPRSALLVSLMKGIELGTTLRMSEVIAAVTGAHADRVAVVSGPNLAREIAERQPAAGVVACIDEDAAGQLQQACHAPYFRPYTNPDVVGCELGGAVKNVIALAVGMAEGMGLGDNTRATIITRGLAETARLGEVLGADPYTFAGLAGLGDLVATCSSPLSRNRTFGERLGQGQRVAEIVASTRQVAEGVKSCESVADLARAHGVDMPITDGVVEVIHNGVAPQRMMHTLLARSAKAERASS